MLASKTESFFKIIPHEFEDKICPFEITEKRKAKQIWKQPTLRIYYIYVVAHPIT